MQVVTSLFGSFAVYYWTMKKKEFQMPHEVLKIVYRQALIWVSLENSGYRVYTPLIAYTIRRTSWIA